MFWDILPHEKAIVDKYIKDAPVRIADLARELGLEVKSSVLPPNISGEIRPSTTASSGFRITVNRHETKERQRFTIAHEITHYLKHRGLIGDGVSDNVMYRSKLSNNVETEANRGAAMLLMPRKLMIDELERKGGVATEYVAREFADRFGVSVPAAKIRLGIG